MTTAIEHLHVNANGINFRVAVSGPPDGPAILCLHGFPEGSMGWRPFMQEMQHARIYAPDLRGYPGTDQPRKGYDVFTLTDDVKALIEALNLNRPLLLTHDWGGALGWIFAHRYSPLIRRLVVVNCTHPKTLVRAVFHVNDWQTFRIPWVPFFELPWIPEAFITSSLGRKLLRWSFTSREGQKGTMNTAVVDEMVARFQKSSDLKPVIDYYRQMVSTQFTPRKHSKLYDVYKTPISAPVTLVWGMEDGALSSKVAFKSAADAGCEVEIRPLPGVGHFVDLEAPEKLAQEITRLL
ncbi:MAG TPA: alpha/beta hydrolase [Pyrinomonadaceae bacterium]|nr:alpha/beta hydrolase [Pyrinomonadaceae bacterium]